MPESTQTSKNPLKIHMTFRDWNQSNHSTNVSAEHMIAAMPNVHEYGIGSAQLAGGTFGQLLIKNDINPYGYVPKLTDHVNKETGPDNRIEVSALFRNEVGLSVSRQAPDVLEHIIRRHAEMGVDRLDNFHHTNDHRMMPAVPHICQKLQDEGHDIYAQAGITIQSNPNSIADKQRIIDEILFEAEKMIESGHKGLYVKNASGVLYPDLGFDTVSALRGNFDQSIGFHMHDTYGYGYQTTLAVIEAGADSVDALPHALAEGTGQISIDKLVYVMKKQGGSMLERLPLVNLDAMRQDEFAAFAVRGQYSGLELPFDPELFEIAEASGSAGGALTSLMNVYGTNLRHAMPKLDDKEILQKVLEKKAEIREALGYVTNVTPTEDMLNAQAVAAVYTEATRGIEVSFYGFSEPTKRFLTGALGKVPVGVDPDLQRRALEEAGLEEVVPVVPFEGRKPEIGALKQELVTKGIKKPTDDEATFLAMNAGEGVSFVQRKRAGELNPTEPQLPRVLDEGGALQGYKGALFQVAYDLLDLHKIEIGHYEGADYHALHKKGWIIDVDDEDIEAASDRFEKVDLSGYADELRQKIEKNIKNLEQSLMEQGADRSLAFNAQKVIVRLASGIGVPNEHVPRMDLTQFPKSKAESPMANNGQTWAQTIEGQGSSGVAAAWGKAEAKSPDRHPPELGVVTKGGDIVPMHPPHEEGVQDVDVTEAGIEPSQ